VNTKSALALATLTVAASAIVSHLPAHHQTQSNALHACLLNDSYIGVTQEDTNHLLAQCLDDYTTAGR
jgi:hypothetical protein